MSEHVKFIFLFLVGTTLLNLAIALAARFKTGHKDYNQLILYWCFLFMTYFAVGALGENEDQIAFAYFLQFLPSFLMVKILCDSRGMRFNLVLYGGIHLIGALISAFLIIKTESHFTLSLLPVTFTTCLPFCGPIWNTLVAKRHEASWIEKAMGLVFLTGIINHFNYAFFRLDPSAAWWGWSISIAQYQSLSVFLPLLINHQRGLEEKKHLGIALETLSGTPSPTSSQVEDMYKTLDQLGRELKNSKAQIEQERELNDILLKTVTHDLANPLMVINSYLDMIRSGRIHPTDVEVTHGKIMANVQSALGMIKRIRTAAVTKNLSFMTKVEKINIAYSLQSLTELFESRLKDKEIVLTVKNLLSSDTLIEADMKTLVEHVFANVLSNAIKFSHRKSEIEIHVLEGEKGKVLVEFRDFGIGLKGNKKIHAPSLGTEGEQGSGLGLHLMGYFLNKFGGSYTISSSENGTAVTLELRKA